MENGNSLIHYPTFLQEKANDRFGYRTGIPYVVQRGIPAIIWYGFQSWIGGTALNEFVKVITGGSFDNAVICFVAIQLVQIALSLYGFHAIKWVEMLASIVFMLALVYAFGILLTSHIEVIAEKWVHEMVVSLF